MYPSALHTPLVTKIKPVSSHGIKQLWFCCRRLFCSCNDFYLCKFSLEFIFKCSTLKFKSMESYDPRTVNFKLFSVPVSFPSLETDLVGSNWKQILGAVTWCMFKSVRTDTHLVYTFGSIEGGKCTKRPSGRPEWRTRFGLDKQASLKKHQTQRLQNSQRRIG